MKKHEMNKVAETKIVPIRRTNYGLGQDPCQKALNEYQAEENKIIRDPETGIVENWPILLSSNMSKQAKHDVSKAISHDLKEWISLEKEKKEDVLAHYRSFYFYHPERDRVFPTSVYDSSWGECSDDDGEACNEFYPYFCEKVHDIFSDRALAYHFREVDVDRIIKVKELPEIKHVFEVKTLLEKVYTMLFWDPNDRAEEQKKVGLQLRNVIPAFDNAYDLARERGFKSLWELQNYLYMASEQLRRHKFHVPTDMD